MTEKGKFEIFSCLMAVMVVVIDQASKFSVLAYLPTGAFYRLNDYLNICLTINFGTSFGILSPNTIYQKYLLICMTVLLILFLVYMFFKIRNNTEKVLCSFIIGGAIGNLIDRFVHGGVVDFIDFHYGTLHWPAFNVADSFISGSVVVMIFLNLFSKRV